MSETSARASRPRKEFRNIGLADITVRFRQPIGAKASILHRVSGALLFLALPVIILPLFAMSVASPAGFAAFAQVAGHPIVKLVLLVLIWAYLHHFCAGIRYLAFDLHKGTSREAGQRSAGVVIGVSLALTVIFGLKLFGAF